jgi:arylsulfatase A-like enzyme
VPQQPNFIVIIPDQLRADALGCFGNPIISTPHIDALANSGTAFVESYVQHPVCSPSRASFLTGWYPHVRGHRTLTHLLQADEPNLLRVLKEAGYHVSWAGERGDTFAPGVTELSVDEYGFAEPVGSENSITPLTRRFAWMVDPATVRLHHGKA